LTETSTVDFNLFHTVRRSKLGPVPIKIPTQPDDKGAIPAPDRGGVQIDRLAFSGEKPLPVPRCGDLAGSHRWSKDRSEQNSQAYLSFHVPPERKKDHSKTAPSALRRMLGGRPREDERNKRLVLRHARCFGSDIQKKLPSLERVLGGCS
jgi:hypothetical protein